MFGRRTLVTAPSSDKTEPVAPVCATVRAGCPVGAHPARSDAVDLPLRQKTCRHCSCLFAICTACDSRVTPTARRAAGRPLGAGRCRLPGPATSAVPRAVSTIATANASIATAGAVMESVFHRHGAIDQTRRP